MDKKHILITRFPYNSCFGGEELHTFQLAKKLRDKGYKVSLFSNCHVLKKLFKGAGMKVFECNSIRPPVSKFSLFSFSLLFWLQYLIWEFELKLILRDHKISHVYMLSLGEKLLLTKFFNNLNIKVVWLEHARIGKWLIKNPWVYYYKKLSKFAIIITTSKLMKMAVEKLGVKAIDIPCWIDKSEYKNLELPPINKNNFRVTTVARLSKDKGVDVLIKAFGLNEKVITETELLIIGHGPEKPKLKKLVDKCKIKYKTRFIRKLDRGDLLATLKSTDIFVLPSTKFDPFGIVIIEAMNLGIPTIITEECGAYSYFKNKEETIIIKPNNIHVLAEAIKYLYRHPDKRLEMGKKGQKKVDTYFVLDKIVEKYIKVLD